MITRLGLIAIIAGVTLCGCVGDGQIDARVSGQIVGDDERPLGPGLVLIEKGKVHQGAYQTGALIGLDGRFKANLSDGGTWGLHLFHDDYTYLPVEITIEPHQQVVLTSLQVAWGDWMDITGEPTWPDQPSDSRLIRMPVDDNPADNPVINDITLTYSGELLEITLDVTDPDQDLSRMILAYDPATGNGFALNPPEAPDQQGNYPNGTYRLSVFVEDVHIPGESKWYFIVSDNLCNNSPIQILTMPPR